MIKCFEIDAVLLAHAVKFGGFESDEAAIEEGLRLLVKTRRQSRIKHLRGQLRWEGPLDEMRRSR